MNRNINLIKNESIKNEEVDKYIKSLGELYTCNILLNDLSNKLNECTKFHDEAASRIFFCPEYFQARKCLKQFKKMQFDYDQKCGQYHKKPLSKQ